MSVSDVNNQRDYHNALIIPIFILIIYYFNTIKEKTNIEKIILLSAVVSLMFNIYFTYNWVTDEP